MGRLKLFEDDSGDEGDASMIEINHEFARRYEHNKKREDLQKYEEMKKQGLASSSETDSTDSEEFSEDEELMKPSKKKDSKFLDALIKMKNHDPILSNKDVKLLNSDDESDDGSEVMEKEEKKKPMYLKDVVSKHLIESGPEFDDEEMQDGHHDNEMEGKRKTYSEEQEELKKEFLKAVEEDDVEHDEEGDFLILKNSGSKDDEDSEEDDFGEKLDEYYGVDDKLDADARFMKDYIRNRMWIDKAKDKDTGDDEIEFSEDEEEIEKQEDYERGYNFRFEENAGDRLLGHSRKVEGSVRKKDNARKSQRERKEERMAQAEFERKEELKRLKNLKKKEINEKLEKIREVAGMGKDVSVFLNEDDLEDEFDPDAYDRKMKEAFGDGYYDEEDADPAFGSDAEEDGLGLEKPDFDKEDELLGLPKGWEDSGEGFVATRERILKKLVPDQAENEVAEDGSDEPQESKRKRKRKPSEVEKAVREQLMEEYYKLDYEDTVGDLKTRFHYKPVKAKRYGLTPKEIFAMDDKDLNQYVSLKKIAPYQEKEWKVPRIKTIQLKQKKVDKLPNGLDASVKARHDTKSKKLEESNTDAEVKSRKSRRRLRLAELKLSRSRLLAYGKIPSKAKSKNL